MLIKIIRSESIKTLEVNSSGNAMSIWLRRGVPPVKAAVWNRTISELTALLEVKAQVKRGCLKNIN